MGGEVSDDAIIQLIDRMGVDHTKGIDFQVFKRILMLFPSRYQALAWLCIRSCDVVGVADQHTVITGPSQSTTYSTTGSGRSSTQVRQTAAASPRLSVDQSVLVLIESAH
jgi:hypothetical protein